MREQVHPEVLAAQGVEEREVRVQPRAALLEPGQRVVVVLARDADVVGRRVDVLDRLLARDLDADGEVLQHLRGAVARLQRERVLVDAALEREGVRVGDLHLRLAAGLDGEDPHAQQAGVDVLEQAGVAQPPDDVLVYLARAVGLDDLAALALAVDEHGEVGQGGLLRQREDVRGFEPPVRAVQEDLAQVRGGDVAFDAHVDAVALDAQGRQDPVLGDHEAGRARGPAQGRRRQCRECHQPESLSAPHLPPSRIIPVDCALLKVLPASGILDAARGRKFRAGAGKNRRAPRFSRRCR